MASCARASSALAARTTRVEPSAVDRQLDGARTGGPRRLALERQAGLTARHREIDLGEDLRVEQCAVQLALRVVDVVALRERVQAVALAGMQPAGQRERVEHAAALADLLRHVRQPLELVIQELDVEIRVVDDELGAPDELDELGRDLRELRLSREEVVLDAVHLERAAVDLALGVDVAVEAIQSRPAIHELHAADLDDPVACARLEARGFRVENDLAHQLRRLFISERTVRVSCPTLPSTGQHFVQPSIGELVGTLVLGVARVSLDPMPGHVVTLGGRGERLPQVLVLDRLLIRRAPAARTPRGQPLHDAAAHVRRIGVEIDAARLA